MSSCGTMGTGLPDEVPWLALETKHSYTEFFERPLPARGGQSRTSRKLMDSYLSIQVLGDDEGLLTIESRAASWGFIGKTRVYTILDELKKWAGDLEEFAPVAGQTVAFYAGERDSYAFLGVSISVLDSVGHCLCHAALESNQTLTFESKNKLEVEIRIEPSAVDQFLLELTTLIQRGQGEAKLIGVYHVTTV